MKLSINRDIISGLFLACLGIYIIKTAARWDFLGDDGPGPGFFPVVYGVIMLVSALGLAGNALLAPFERSEADKPRDFSGTMAALVAVAALAIGVPLMSVLGFVVGFGLVAFFLVRFVFQKSWLAAGTTAAAIAIGLYVLFPMLLGSPLPVGMVWSF